MRNGWKFLASFLKQCMHGAKRIHLCNVCHVLPFVSSIHFLHINPLSFSISTHTSYLLSQIIYLSSFMDYSPTQSPFTSPEPTPPPSPPYYIEEPKTLSEKELNELRAAALHILNTHTPEEATRIFLKGLIPVNGVNPNALPAPPKENKVPETVDNVKNGAVDNVKK